LKYAGFYRERDDLSLPRTTSWWIVLPRRRGAP